MDSHKYFLDIAKYYQILLDRVEIKRAYDIPREGAEIEVEADPELHVGLLKDALAFINLDYDEFKADKANRFTGLHSDYLFQK